MGGEGVFSTVRPWLTEGNVSSSWLRGRGKYPEIWLGGKHSKIYFARAFGARGFSVSYYAGRCAQKHAVVGAVTSGGFGHGFLKYSKRHDLRVLQ